MKNIFEEMDKQTTDIFEYLSDLFRPEELPKSDKSESKDNSDNN